MPQRKTRPDICDYEGSNYRTEFWENQGREYEDRVERIALRRLLPADGGRRLLEIGAGFGRLTEEYAAFDQVVLLDYSFSQLQYARDHHGDSERFVYVAADAYHMPFRPGTFDAASMIRTIHHMEDVASVLAQVRRVLTPEAVFILEHANKQNIKAMLRYATRQQAWSPYNHEPVEFVELNFDFHPEYIRQRLADVGFKLEKRMPVSFFRVEAIKRTMPTHALVALDSLLQWTGMLYTPSIFTRSRSIATGPNGPDNTSAPLSEAFACPETGASLRREGDTLVSRETGLHYAVRDGIYDFKAPLD